MKNFLINAMAWIFFIMAGLGIVWIVQGNSFFIYQYFAPKYENVRRTTFEQSKAYNQGMAQQLSNQMQEYEQATQESKDSLATIIVHEYADYDLTEFQPYQRTFIEKLRRGER